jgi:hypothetical protein
VGVFRNPAALLRLAGSVLVEAHNEWQVADERYLSDAIVLAVPWPAAHEAVASLGDVNGKLLVDVTNPLLPDFSWLDGSGTVLNSTDTSSPPWRSPSLSGR